MAGQSFRPGEEVIWLKRAGGFVFPVLARVVAITPKRVTITADDPDERGEGVVTRHVPPSSLQPKTDAPRRRPARGASQGSRPGKGAPAVKVTDYLNTDLDLTSANDLTALAAAFDAGGVPPLYVTRGRDGRWYATFETREQHSEPEPNIADMLAVVESLDPALRSVWRGCSRREFNIGYACGLQPWAFNQGMSAELLGRIAAVGAALRITLYPDREQATSSRSPQQTGEA